MKKCSSCKEKLRKQHFNLNQSYCKSCQKDYRQDNKDKIKEYYNNTIQPVVYMIEEKGICLYIGSTNNLIRRINNHITDAYNPSKRSYGSMLYTYIRNKNLTRDDLLKKVRPVKYVEDIDKLRIVEQQAITYFTPIFNIRRAVSNKN